MDEWFIMSRTGMKKKPFRIITLIFLCLSKAEYIEVHVSPFGRVGGGPLNIRGNMICSNFIIVAIVLFLKAHVFIGFCWFSYAHDTAGY